MKEAYNGKNNNKKNSSEWLWHQTLFCNHPFPKQTSSASSSAYLKVYSLQSFYFLLFFFSHQLYTAQLFLRAVPLHSDNTPAAGCTRGESKGSQQLFLGLGRSSTSSAACPVPGEHAPEPVSPFQSSLGDTHPQQRCGCPMGA